MPREVDRVVGTTGRPAILSAKLPRRRVITNAPDAAGTTEAFITAKDLKRAKTKISSSRPHDMKGHLQRALAKHRAGKPLGATEKARLKARGLIARADGTVRKGKLGKR